LRDLSSGLAVADCGDQLRDAGDDRPDAPDGERTGWLQASETLSFLRGHLSILETWGRSPSEFFLSTPASASPDSPAGAALEGVGAERIGILTPLEDGSMRLLDQWDKGQQHQLGAWLSLFSAW